MRLAISATTPTLDATSQVELARHAEHIGLGEAWVAEVSGPEPFALMAAIAGATENIDLGVAVMGAAQHSPATLAMGAGTVSQLLEGRELWLGIGSSSRFMVESWHDSRFDPAVTRVRESAEATRALLAGERSYRGEAVSVDRFQLATPPSGPVRVVIGALRPRMLRAAGAVADGVCLNLVPPSAVARQRAEIEEGAGAVGRALPEHFKVMARIMVVPTDDLASGHAIVTAMFAPYFAQPSYNGFLDWLGFPEEAAEIREGFAAGDRERVAAAVHPGVADAVAVVGDAERIATRLAEFGENGLDVAALGFIVDGFPAAIEALERVVAVSS